jgi:hypothetical protein
MIRDSEAKNIKWNYNQAKTYALNDMSDLEEVHPLIFDKEKDEVINHDHAPDQEEEEEEITTTCPKNMQDAQEQQKSLEFQPLTSPP